MKQKQVEIVQLLWVTKLRQVVATNSYGKGKCSKWICLMDCYWKIYNSKFDSLTAMGSFTTASGDIYTAMGRCFRMFRRTHWQWVKYNYKGSWSPTFVVVPIYSNSDNTALVIGNGTDSDNRSDALVVKFNGDTTLAGSMTATSFIGDGSQLTNLPTGGSSPLSYNNNQEGGIEIADYTTCKRFKSICCRNR